jgi:hypothetical protein
MRIFTSGPRLHVRGWCCYNPPPPTVKPIICYETLHRASDQDGFFGTTWAPENGRNGELHNLYSWPDIIRQIKSRWIRWAGHVARMGERSKVYRVLVGKPKGKRPLEWPRHRWEDGIRMDLRETGLEGVEWIHLAQDKDRWRAVVNTVMNLGVLAPRS